MPPASGWICCADGVSCDDGVPDGAGVAPGIAGVPPRVVGRAPGVVGTPTGGNSALERPKESIPTTFPAGCAGCAGAPVPGAGVTGAGSLEFAVDARGTVSRIGGVVSGCGGGAGGGFADCAVGGVTGVGTCGIGIALGGGFA